MQRAVASDLVAGTRRDPSSRWGVIPGPALWPTVLRILFVVDGRIDTTTCPETFGLGYVLKTLRDDAFAWWVRFKVQVVRRDHGENTLPKCPPPDSDPNDTAPGANPSFAISDFKFTEPNFDLDDWDQVWFFGDYPANEQGAIDEARFHPLDDPELKLLAEWMDRGGGVFATGDHWNLGASMCSRIPRVRTMRRWTPEQGVPTMDGDSRNETLQPTHGYEDLWEGDVTPQPVEVTYVPRMGSVLARPLFPHALMSTPTGVINRFPDHMHEGDVIDDAEVELDRPLDIPGYARPEYPAVRPPTHPTVASGGPIPPQRPRPHVVAFGRTTNPAAPERLGLASVALGSGSALATKRFGLVGAYDGDPVGIGRVVVDSTWHHWFSYNLHGFASADPPTIFELMQSYYRNVGIWLATPQQRRSMLVAATWGPVVSDPMAFPPARTRSLWAVGKRALEVMERTLSPSMVFDFVASCLDGDGEQVFNVPPSVGPADPSAAAVPPELAARAIVGGIASSLIEPAADYLQAEGRPRRLLDAGAIARHVAEGVREGQRELLDALRSSAAAIGEVVGRLEETFPPVSPEPISVSLIGLRVVAQRLQIPDLTDPALANGRPTITAKVSVAGTIAAETVLEGIDLPAFEEAAGAVLDLDQTLFDGVVQTGESLVVDIVTGEAARDRPAPDSVRFSEKLQGDPSSWVGTHAPSRKQAWRFWYRIERAEDGDDAGR
jgi:hypothetical protein